MRRTAWLLLLCATIALAVLPAEAAAQHRRAVRVSRPVVVAGGYYRPYYYRPYFYDPFYWGFHSWYPYGPYRYPPFGYYPRFYYSNASSARIQVTPREAEVYLDGYYVGLVDDFDGFSQRLEIPPGEHELEVYLEGYRSFREKRLFLPRTSYHIKQTMQRSAEGEQPAARPSPKEQPLRPPVEGRPDRRGQPYGEEPRGARSDFGTLRLRTQPGDATVRVDGQEWERPADGDPFVIELAEGTHRIEVVKDGFKPYTREIQIRSGETTAVNVSLPEQ